MFKPLFALLLSLFLFAACDSGDSISSAAVQYQITVARNDTTAATGQFSFVVPATGSNSTGSFMLSTPSGDPLAPITSTSGSMMVSLSNDGTIDISISDPNVSDSGLGFHADYSASGFSGTWNTITIVGPVEQGTFTATRVATAAALGF